MVDCNVVRSPYGTTFLTHPYPVLDLHRSDYLKTFVDHYRVDLILEPSL